MLCETAQSSVAWVTTFFALMTCGMCFVGLGSWGNVQGNEQVYKPLLAGSFVLLIAAIGSFIDSHSSDLAYIKAVTVTLCTAVAIFHFLHVAYLLAPETSKWKDCLNRHALQDEVNHKRATAYKLNRLIENALEI